MQYKLDGVFKIIEALVVLALGCTFYHCCKVIIKCCNNVMHNERHAELNDNNENVHELGNDNAILDNNL